MYFEAKARELLDRRKEDNLSLAAANLLFKSLNLKMENFLNSPINDAKEKTHKTIGASGMSTV